MIPQNIILLDYSLSTSSLLLVLGAIVSLFFFWHETRRDGFDEEKSFDLFFICLLSGVILSRLTFAALNDFNLKTTFWHVIQFWHSGFNIPALAIGLLLPLFFFSRLWRWSIYRLTDIFVLSICPGLSIIFFGWYLMTNDPKFVFGGIFYLILYYALLRIRLQSRSGLVFSLFIIFNIMYGLIFFNETNHLIFYSVFFTISLVNLYYREKKNPMSTGLSKNFISSMKDRLTSKEKELEAEQQKLLDSDPYLQEGRDQVDEYLDDVNEDIEKEIYDNKVKSVNSLSAQVKRALARIKIGSYGICEVCGNQISKERLEAFPEATTCLSCSQKSADSQ